MKMKMKWLGAAVALLGLTGASAQAAGSAYLNIDVTITNNVSVSVVGSQSSTQSVTWSGAGTMAAAATALVTNDSGYLSERWELTTTARSWDSTSGVLGWTIGATQATDQLKLQAVFGATSIGAGACNGGLYGDSNVSPALVSTTQVPYTQTVLADTALGAGGNAAKPDTAGNLMLAGSTRKLCWQMTMPTSTSLTGVQVVPIIVTAF